MSDNGCSSTLGELTKALITARREFPSIPKTKTASAGSYSYKYADLGDIIAAVAAPLGEQGLAFVQPIAVRDGQPIVVTRLQHVSGEWIASECPFTVHERPQETGSAITYARRYSLTALLGIAADEDDDGQTAQKSKKGSGEGTGGGRQGSKARRPRSETPADLTAARSAVVEAASEAGIEAETAKRLLAGWFKGVSSSKDLDEMQCKAAVEGFERYGKLLKEVTELGGSGPLQDLSTDELRALRDELKGAK